MVSNRSLFHPTLSHSIPSRRQRGEVPGLVWVRGWDLWKIRCVVYWGEGRGARGRVSAKWLTLCHQSLMIASTVHCFVPAQKEIASGNANIVLPSHAVAVPCLHPLSTYRLNRGDGKGTKAPLLMKMWAEQQGATCLMFPQVRGAVSVQAFAQSIFQDWA